MEVFVTISAEGKIVNKQTIRKAFLNLIPGRYKVVIDKAKKRTNPQNAYFHGVIVPLVYDGLRDVGFSDVRTHEDAKTVLKSLFLKKSITNDIETFEIIKDTHSLSTVEFNELIEDVIKWAAEYLSIEIPYPNEQLEVFQ